MRLRPREMGRGAWVRREPRAPGATLLSSLLLLRNSAQTNRTESTSGGETENGLDARLPVLRAGRAEKARATRARPIDCRSDCELLEILGGEIAKNNKRRLCLAKNLKGADVYPFQQVLCLAN